MTTSTQERNRELASLYLVHTLTPVHVGIGEALGDINLPTMREQLTGYPILPGSSVKGILRDAAVQKWGVGDSKVQITFGPEKEQASKARGGLVFSDANLLALPVRSLYGTFAWVTCPFVLHRLARDAQQAETAAKLPGLHALRSLDLKGSVRVPPQSALMPAESEGGDSDRGGGKGKGGPRLFLNELMITDVTVDRDLETLGEALAGQLFSDDAPMKTFFTQRLLIVPDDWFGYLSRRGLEVRARVKMDPQTGTAASSGPWKEEYLPTESLLFGLMVGRRTVQLKEGPGKGDPSRSNQRQDQQQPDEKPEPVEPHKPSDYLTELLQDARVLRLGGKSSVGGGRVRFTLFT